MAACTEVIVGSTGQGFTLSADKTKDSQPFLATLHISYPTKPNETVSIVEVRDWALDQCVQDVQLDGNGEADVQYQVNQTITIYALHGFGCCTFTGPGCTQSNRLALSVGTSDWTTIALIGAGILGLAYILGNRGSK